MKTEISSFYKEFEEVLSPLNSALKKSIDGIQDKPDCDALKIPLAGLADVNHRLETLIHKVQEQQAYVIIFGPLKSGKSTLMNAISGAYVSEVTSLPAYPCLVYVKHSDEQKFLVSRYNGKKVTSTHSGSMQLLIKDAHATLAERIREVEERSEAFDPGVHYPEAIRRVDVELPAKNLKDSWTVLVDTPGLYSRMKFGYDLMTREFRNSAACAVFVVKTDNLFLEQVFDEFNDLLGLFSRIFLVVNIDTNKQDLRPDGSLRPSLESDDPGKIIDAFESLAMSAPLRKAAEEGRLRIYPIDLLNSAATSLRQVDEGADGEATADDSPGDRSGSFESEAASNGEAEPVATIDAEEQESDAAESEEPEAGHEEADEEDDAAAPGENEFSPIAAAAVRTGAGDKSETSFAVFLKDLTDYLNSSDYLLEFMGDSLRQGKTLSEEIERHCAREGLLAFHNRQSSIEQEMRVEKQRLEAVEKLEKLDWEKSFEKGKAENKRQAESFSQELKNQVIQSVQTGLDNWFDTDESLRDLEEKHLNPALKECEATISRDAASRVRALVSNSIGGAELSPDMLRSLDRLNLALAPIHKSCSNSVLGKDIPIASCAIRIPSDTIPVAKGFFDLLFFRRQAVLRKRLFGEPDELDRAIPVKVKKRRLGTESKELMKEAIETHLNEVFPAVPVQCSDELISRYIELFSKEIKKSLRSAKEELNNKVPELDSRISANKNILTLLSRLTGVASGVVQEVGRLQEVYGASEIEASLEETESADDDENGPSEDEDSSPEDEDSSAGELLQRASEE